MYKYCVHIGILHRNWEHFMFRCFTFNKKKKKNKREYKIK